MRALLPQRSGKTPGFFRWYRILFSGSEPPSSADDRRENLAAASAYSRSFESSAPRPRPGQKPAQIAPPPVHRAGASLPAIPQPARPLSKCPARTNPWPAAQAHTQTTRPLPPKWLSRTKAPANSVGIRPLPPARAPGPQTGSSPPAQLPNRALPPLPRAEDSPSASDSQFVPG